MAAPSARAKRWPPRLAGLRHLCRPRACAAAAQRDHGAAACDGGRHPAGDPCCAHARPLSRALQAFARRSAGGARLRAKHHGDSAAQPHERGRLRLCRRLPPGGCERHLTMCGIAGIFHLDGRPPSPVILRAMTDAIAHRGPDGEGAFTDGALALGHRRLAIIDLTSAGHQPMATLGADQVITYNGEVYNFLELRSELEALGYRFRSRTDTEVVLNAIAEWGDEAIGRFNGMFAFAHWDRRARRLLLVRDRFGVKPLYYCVVGKTVLFASE